MRWFHCSDRQNEKNQWLAGKEAVQDPHAEKSESLYWTALIITGNQDAAEQSIVDAGVLADTNSYAFRDWLVRWGRSTTARAAVNTVRAFIHETAEQYAGRKCSHRTHQPLAPAEIQSLRELDAYDVIHGLDILARTSLVLYGCQHASLSECALVLDVPVQTVVAAYCRALEWYHKHAEKPDIVEHSDCSRLYLVRYDSDGVPVWDYELPNHKR
jgi:DNA-directed RNA polymerase specialized sigma24 family protein